MKPVHLLFCLAGLLSSIAIASTIAPPVLPLVVRNPYLSLWFNTREAPWENWPMFWHGQEIGLGILARIASTSSVFPLLGRPQTALNSGNGYTVSAPTAFSFQYDASTTNLTYTLSPDVKVVLVFTSPITDKDTMRQAIPASYLNVIVEGNTAVDVYLDVNGLWVTHDRHTVVQWGFSPGSTINSWSVHRRDQLAFTEHADRGEWGTLYFSGPSDAAYAGHVSVTCRKAFAKYGTLPNTFDKHYREVANEEPVFAFSKHFHLTDSVKTQSALFTIAYIQDPITQYAGASGFKPQRPLWVHKYKTATDLLNFHYGDYPTAYSMGQAYADKVNTHARKAVSDNYADILSLSARQVMGAVTFSGDPSHPLLFLKEISSNGNMQTVDVIFPAYPFFLYTNPDWLAYLLEPLLEHQNAGLYPNKYSIHDLGAHFPNATGHADGTDEPMPVEECGNMLAMGASYARHLASNGTDAGKRAAKNWIDKDGRYRLWKQWAGFLIEFGLIPDIQLSTDDFAGRLANQTNLAMKAIVGIRAMAELSEFMNDTGGKAYYKGIGESYVPLWENFAISRDRTHTKLSYTHYGSWGTLYNLYPDALLCFPEEYGAGYIPHDVYRNQSRWYWVVHQNYGLPLDSRHLYTKSDWEIWAAAISSKPTRHLIIDLLAKWLNETVTNRPFTDLYHTETGDFPGIYFMARPVAGGHFAILALDQSCSGKGLSYLDNHVFASSAEEEAAATAIDVKVSLQKDIREGPANMLNLPLPPEVARGRAAPVPVSDVNHAEFETGIYLTKEVLGNGIGCWWKGGCDGEEYPSKSQSLAKTVKELKETQQMVLEPSNAHVEVDHGL